MIKLSLVAAMLCLAGCYDVQDAPPKEPERHVAKEPPPRELPPIEVPVAKKVPTPTPSPTAEPQPSPTPGPTGTAEAYQFVHPACCFGMHLAVTGKCTNCEATIGVQGHLLCVKCANQKKVCPHCLK